jgi:hypothetical protein
VQTPFEGNRVVRLSFSKADAPERIVFVLKELQPENWINNGSCYSVQVRWDAAAAAAAVAVSLWQQQWRKNSGSGSSAVACIVTVW